MANNEDRTIVDVVEVVRHPGTQVSIPEEISLDRVINSLIRERDYQDELTYVSAPFTCLPGEGAVALNNVLKREFGFVHTKRRTNAQMREVRVGPNETASVNWGQFEVPSLDPESEYLATSAESDSEDRIVFAIGGRIKRKNEKIFKQLVEMVRDEIRTNSIYKQRAWRIRLHDDDGDIIEMPEPEFLELNPNLGESLVFSEDVVASLQINLWGFLEHTEEFRKRGTSLKRGVLMVGSYGTGKSMTATETANIAIRNGWTYIVCDNANELQDVARLAREYGPAVVFCEDIDRVASGQRNISMDELLNVVDGIESKNVELILVFTTNDLDAIHEAMLRPGRIDGVITLQFPDAAATERMIRVYAGNSLPADVDISRAVEVIANQRTSAVAEVANRAISANIIRGKSKTLTSDDVYEAALSVKNQLDGLAKSHKDRELSDIERAANTLVSGFRSIVPANRASGNGHPESVTIPLSQQQG